jgi:amino acid transporter
MIVITGLQAVINHFGIRLTSILTDFSGYLIFFGAIAIAAAFFAFAPAHPIARLWEFRNYSGDPGGNVWPQTGSVPFLFLLGLLLPIYTITGYDASAHTSEETHKAALNAPKSMVGSVVWSALFGWVCLSAVVIAIPDMDQAAAQGFNVFFWISDQVLPAGIKYALYVVIFLAQLLCGLATVTSVSRMIFAFARDGGLPGSPMLRRVSPRFRTPVAAIWTGAVLAVLFTAYTPLYTTIVSVTVIFLFLSFCVPITLGLIHYRRKWSIMGPWDIGPWFPVFAVLSLIAMILILVIGVQPPNDAALSITVGFLALTTIVWFALERRRFKGPPIGAEIARREAEIRAAEAAVGETG